MATLNIDEINSIDTSNDIDSSDFYAEYFGEMELSEEEIEERIELANKFESIFFFIFSLIAVDSINEELKSDKYYSGLLYGRYCSVVSDFYKEEVTEDSYIGLLANRQSELIVDTTLLNITDAYYSSENRAINISANETNSVANYYRELEAIKQGKTHKIWRCRLDGKERKTHKIANGQTVLIGQPFEIGNSRMMFPHDKSLDAEDKEIIHCRCVCKYF